VKLRIPTARAFKPLVPPKRYKGASGGRGSGKTQFFCEAMVLDMLDGHRCLCLREVQNSIKDSDKQVVEDSIAKLGLEKLFRITDQEISGPRNSLMIFRGLQNHTASTIKSLEGFTRAFVDEAQTITKRSLELLTPTIRAPGSELWFGWNPELPDDPVDKFFRENAADPHFVHVKVNYNDNPWFPAELRQDMERDKRRDPEKYAHVWLGGYQRNSEARVFKNWRVESFETPLDVPRFYFGADFGFANDPAVMVRCWIRDRTLFVDYEVCSAGVEIDHTPAMFAKVPGAQQWPSVADSANPQSISYLKRHGFPRMTAAVKGPGSIEEGVEFLKSYDIVAHPRCRNTIDELTMYSYEVDDKTGEVLPKLKDKKNNVIDALRYATEPLRQTQTKRAYVNFMGR
jgi:phage terminase large subunit